MMGRDELIDRFGAWIAGSSPAMTIGVGGIASISGATTGEEHLVPASCR